MKLVNFYFLLFILQNTASAIPIRQIKQMKIQEAVSPLALKVTKTQAVVELCSPYPDRSQLVNQQDLKDAQVLRNSVKQTIGIDGLALFKLMANGNNSQAGQMVTSNLSGPIIFGLQFAVGFVVLFFIWPFLLCCCICGCCCCSIQNKKVSKALLIALALSLTLAIAMSIYGLVETMSVGDSIQKAGCSAAIIPDDILYGNSTSNGKQFFTGFYSLEAGMRELQSNLVNIANNFSIIMPGSSDPTIDNVLSLCKAAQIETIKISNNDTTGSDLVLNYPTPINETDTVGSVTSLFSQVLGSYSSRSGLIWSIYSALDSLNQTLQTLRSNSQSYNNEIGNINQDISSIENSVSQIINEIERDYKQVSEQLPQVKAWIRISDLSVKIYYGVVIVFSTLGMLAAFYITKSSVFKILLYTSCTILFWSALIGFTVALGFTFALPPLAWSCDFIENSMLDQISFQANFNFLIDNETLKDISVCMPFADGNILSKIGVNAVAGINNLTAVIDELNSFDVQVYRRQIEGNLSVGSTYIADFTSTRIIDIDDRSSLAILSKIASPSFAGYQNCNQNLNFDSWVPSDYQNIQYPGIACTSKTGQIGNDTTCPNGIAEVGTCGGCMDSAQILNYYYRNASKDFNADLATRYGNTCTFNQQLQNIWKNYYQVKANILGPDVQGTPSSVGVLPRTMAAKAGIDSLISQIDPALPNIFSNVLSGLNSINNLIDPKTGLLAGLNCRLMGQDFQRLQRSVCGSLFKDVYATRLALGIASYGILLALCLFACVGRYRKRVSTSLMQQRIDQPHYYKINTYRQDYDTNFYVR